MTEAESKTKSETNGSANGEDSNEPTDLERKIIRQVEYYFGDFNLPKDKFLKEQIKLDDGWIPLDIMPKFQRLANLTSDIDAIKAAIKKSRRKLIEISEDGKSIRRSPDKPVPVMTDKRQEEIMARSVYVKGFPKEGTDLDMVSEYMDKFGLIDNIQLRTYYDKPNKKVVFKGSIFVTFGEKAEAEKFIETKGLKYKDEELILKWQADYMEEKQKEWNKKKLKKKEKEANSKKEDGGGGEDEEKEENEEEEEKEEIKLPLGAVLHMKGFSSETGWEDIKSAFAKYDPNTAYVDYKKGEPEGWLRLKKENSAKPIFEKIPEGKVEVKGSSVEVRVLDGEEEAAFLKKVREEMAERMRSRNTDNRRGRRGRGGWRGGRGRKRKGGPHSDGPSAKK